MRAEAERVGKPQGLGWVAAAFLYLTVVGVVFPVGALALRPVLFLSSSLWHIVMVPLFGLFVSGLAVVAGSLIRAVRRLPKH